MASSHLIANAQFAFAGDINLHLLDDTRIDIVPALDSVERTLFLEVEFSKFVFKRTDDLPNLVTNGARIDVYMIVDTSELAEQRFSDLSIRRNDDFAGFGIDYIERDFLT